jgi:hypothetical protein
LRHRIRRDGRGLQETPAVHFGFHECHSLSADTNQRNDGCASARPGGDSGRPHGIKCGPSVPIFRVVGAGGRGGGIDPTNRTQSLSVNPFGIYQPQFIYSTVERNQEARIIIEKNGRGKLI